MWVSGRKTKGPNAALGFSTFSPCQPWNKAQKSQPLLRGPICSNICFPQPHVCHTLEGERASKYDEGNYVERDRKRGRERGTNTQTHSQSYWPTLKTQSLMTRSSFFAYGYSFCRTQTGPVSCCFLQVLLQVVQVYEAFWLPKSTEENAWFSF